MDRPPHSTPYLDHANFLAQGVGQLSQVMCRAQRNIDALLMPVAMVARPANKPTIVATTAILF
jgi:hypothetical protein